MNETETQPTKKRLPKAIYAADLILLASSQGNVEEQVHARYITTYVAARNIPAAHRKVAKRYGDDLVAVRAINLVAIEQEADTNQFDTFLP